jgi:DNA-binding NarL/FixJ family response regulator
VGTRMGAEARLDENQPMAPTILIVDDHPSFRASARRLLEADGYEVVGEVPDGESALEAVRELRPEIVLLDVQLPGLDGFEVAAQLTNGGGGPAVVLTSSRDASDVEPYAAASGARGFVPKNELSGEALAALLR